MLTIGFTNQYYTLWSVSEPYNHFYSQYEYDVKQDYSYYQNLSFDLSEAKSKVESKYPETPYLIDLSLRGESGSYTNTLNGERLSNAPDWMFSFGKLKYQDIRESDDVWQLDRAYGQEKNARTRVHARRRLIDLGELVKYEWVDTFSQNVNWDKQDENGHLLPEKIEDVKRVKKYATLAQIAAFEKEKNKPVAGHYETDGAKVVLELKEIDSFGFNGNYGYTYVVTYADINNREFKYMGSSPSNISQDEFVKVQATIAHDTYRGNETKLKRIKVLAK